jgi:hypothetical protein
MGLEDKEGSSSRKALSNPWPGYKEPRTWGKWFVIEWPNSHPDTHCEAGEYAPGDHKVCVCSWIPADAVCCEEHKTPLRDSVELGILKGEIASSSCSHGAMFIAYQAYVDKNRSKLTAPPSFGDIKKWWNKLKGREQGDFIHTYRGRMDSPLEDLLPLILLLDLLRSR